MDGNSHFDAFLWAMLPSAHMSILKRQNCQFWIGCVIVNPAASKNVGV